MNLKNNMDIEIKKYLDRGNLEKERILFSVKSETFLGKYLVGKSKKKGDQAVSSELDTIYWFPDAVVKNNDLVVLYTKAGKTNTKLNTDGTTTHFFYWQKPETMWEDSNSTVILLNLAEWNFKINSDT